MDGNRLVRKVRFYTKWEGENCEYQGRSGRIWPRRMTERIQQATELNAGRNKG
jgi:hypothetical protein